MGRYQIDLLCLPQLFLRLVLEAPVRYYIIIVCVLGLLGLCNALTAFAALPRGASLLEPRCLALGSRVLL